MPVHPPVSNGLAFTSGKASRERGVNGTANGFYGGQATFRPKHPKSQYPIMPCWGAVPVRSGGVGPGEYLGIAEFGQSTATGSGLAAGRERSARFARTARRPCRSMTGRVVSTFGNAERFGTATPAKSTPGPQSYATQYNHPNTSRHVFRNELSPQPLGGGPKVRTQHGFVSEKLDVFIPIHVCAEVSPHSYTPRYPTVAGKSTTFNKQFRLQQERFDITCMPRPPPSRPRSAPSVRCV